MSAAERRTAGSTWPPTRTIVLCATPRTGSTLACDVLAGTERLGYPKEPFAAVAVRACAQAWAVPDLDADPDTYLRAALTNGTTPNGICAVKVMWEDVPRLARATDRHEADVLDCFVDPVALLVTRRDVLAAAISQHRAEQTGEWSSDDASARTRPDAPDLDRVSSLHDAQHDGVERWRALVAGAAVPSAEVVYEDVAGEPGRIAAVAARLVGVRLDAAPEVRTRLRVQRDDWNERVRHGWIEHTGGCTRGCPA